MLRLKPRNLNRISPKWVWMCRVPIRRRFQARENFQMQMDSVITLLIVIRLPILKLSKRKLSMNSMRKTKVINLAKNKSLKLKCRSPRPWVWSQIPRKWCPSNRPRLKRSYTKRRKTSASVRSMSLKSSVRAPLGRSLKSRRRTQSSTSIMQWRFSKRPFW